MGPKDHHPTRPFKVFNPAPVSQHSTIPSSSYRCHRPTPQLPIYFTFYEIPERRMLETARTIPHVHDQSDPADPTDGSTRRPVEQQYSTCPKHAGRSHPPETRPVARSPVNWTGVQDFVVQEIATFPRVTVGRRRRIFQALTRACPELRCGFRPKKNRSASVFLGEPATRM